MTKLVVQVASPVEAECLAWMQAAGVPVSQGRDELTIEVGLDAGDDPDEVAELVQLALRRWEARRYGGVLSAVVQGAAAALTR